MANTSSNIDAAQIVALLRARMFSLTREELGLAETTAEPWGVMMEIGYESDVVTLVTLADGSVSVYLQSGTGRIGCGLHRDVRAAAARTLKLAQTIEWTHVPASPYDVPRAGSVRFYFHTSNGLRSIDALRTELDRANTELVPLYSAALAVIGMVELTSAGQPIADAIEDAAGSVKSESTFASKSKPCRILPYAGSAARRSRR